MEITEFLLARIAEDEAMARAAIDPFVLIEGNERPEWQEPDDGAWTQEGNSPSVNGEALTIYDEGGHHLTHAVHIARWDPKRVLAECASKRVIAEEHQSVRDDGWKSGEEHDYLWCASCGSLDDSPVPFPCFTTQALAAVYSDHPDYRQEWTA